MQGQIAAFVMPRQRVVFSDTLAAMNQKRRAIGITRVSQEGDREHIHSYATQAARIETDCADKGTELLYIGQERNVSGGSDLSNRPELSKAVEAVENGTADTIIAAYFDRFFRSLEVQTQVIRRIERAGGELLTLDHGTLTNATPAKRLQANIVGAMAQYFRELTAEKTAEAQARAVARGVAPWSRQPGYVRNDDGVFIPGPDAPHIQKAFRMRAKGATIKEIRAYLRDNGVPLLYTSVCDMLKSRTYLGEIRFGELVNLTAHDKLIDVGTFNKVQRMKIPRGHSAKSDRLLARLNILRCGSCGARMTVGSNNLGAVNYRCPPTSLCERRMAISATVAERVVAAEVQKQVHSVYGLWNKATANRRHAVKALDHAIANHAAFMSADLDFTNPINVSKAKELETHVAECQERVDRTPAGARTKLTITEDWSKLTLRQQRDLIVSLVDSVTVEPGRGEKRVKVKMIELPEDA